MLPLLTQGGGAEKYFIELARNLRTRGIEADVVTMDENFFRKFARLLHIFTRGNFFGKIEISGRESENAVHEKLGGAHWIKTSRKNLGATLRKYATIYSKNEIVDLALLKLIGYKKLPPIVVGVHTPIFFPDAKSFITKLHNWLYSGFLYKWLLRDVKCIHVSNKAAKDLIDKKFKAKCRLIYYPFSVEEIKNAAGRNQADIQFSNNKTKIIFVGRLSEQKGFDRLTGLIERLGKDNELKDKIQLNVFGTGGTKENDEIKICSEKFDFVGYFGHVENKFIPDILGRQDLMIAPSRWETLPYNILEAQAMGLPVVAFDIPGPNDIIKDGQTGVLAKSRVEFMGAIENFTNGTIRFDKNRIISNIEKRFDPEKIYSELINMFQETVCEK